MKDFLDLARDRRSIREFQKAPIDFAFVIEVIRAGTYAPSVGDLQPWRFVVVTDDDLKKSLCNECPSQSWMHNAPVLIVVLSDADKVKDYYGDPGVRWCDQSVAAAVQNMLLAAHDLGFGACWVGSFDKNNVRSLLGIPDGIVIDAIVALGKPDETPQPKTITPLDQNVYFNGFGEKTEDMSVVLRDWGEYLRKRAKTARPETSPRTEDEEQKSFFDRARDLLRRQR